MEINRLMFNYIKQNIPKETLREDSVFQGNIVDIDGDLVFINIPGEGIIRAESSIDLEKYLGESIKFIVKSETEEGIEIKPMIEELVESPEDELNRTISRLLKDNNLKESDLSRELIKNLMELDVPLTEENLSESIKTLEKLQDLIALGEETVEVLGIDEGNSDSEIDQINRSDFEVEREALLEGLKLLDKDQAIDDSSINMDLAYETKDKGNIQAGLKENIQLIREELESLPELEKELDLDIKNILIKDEVGSSQGKSEEIIKKALGDLGETLTDEDLIDISSFMTKHKIKPSLNNIKNLQDFMEEPFEFMKDFIELSDLVHNKKLEPSKKALEIVEDEDDKESIKDLLKEPSEDIKTRGKLNLDDKDKMLEIRNKAEFIKDLNKDIYFHMIPINYGEKELEGFINIVKNKKKRNSGEDGKLNIFINLDTENLGRIKISCQAKYEDLKIKIFIKEEDRLLFESAKAVLQERIEKLGFNVEELNFSLEKQSNFLDDMKAESKKLHFLDIKV